jgi:imidazolonepropionase-like amidohydrolase
MTEEAAAEFRKNAAKSMEEVESFFRRARHYADVQKTDAHKRDATVEFDRRLDAMIPYVRGDQPVYFRANSYKAIREALAFAKRYELRPVIFGGTEAWKLSDELRDSKADVIVVRSMAYPGGRFEPWDSVYRNAATLHRAGVRFCFATDEPSLAKQLGIEAGMAAAHGLSADAAVRAITLDAAAILGIDNRYGSLESGKSATLFVSTDSPLQASNAVVSAFIEGRPVELANKHTQDDAKFRARPAPGLPPAKDLRGPPRMTMQVADWPGAETSAAANSPKVIAPAGQPTAPATGR